MKKSIFLFFAAILCAMSVSAKTVYLNTGGSGLWNQADAWFAMYLCNGTEDAKWYKMTAVPNAPDVYQVDVDDALLTVAKNKNVIFARRNPDNTNLDWNGIWNQTADLENNLSSNNCYTITGWGGTDGSWSTYTPPTTVPDYYLTGTLAGGWNANEIKMTYDEATETHSHTFTAVAANAEQKIKVTDGTWSNSWGGAAVSPAIDGITTDGDGNVCFTLKTAGDVTITFKDTKIQVTTTGEFKVPVVYPYYIMGTMNSWSVKEEYGLADEDEDGVYTREITLAAGEHFFKINIGKWDSQWGWSNVVGVYTEATDASDDNKIKITLASEKTFVVEFNKSKNQITFDGLTEIEDYYTVVGVAELFGEAWATASETNKMVKQGDGSYKLVKENVTLAAIGYDWKIAKNGDWWKDAATGVNPSEGNNTLTITTAGRYNVTFTLAADLTSVTVETELLEAIVVIPDCFISGNKNLTGEETEWQGNEFTMVYDEETETWSYTLAGLQPEKEYELKVVCGETWYSYADLASIPTGVTEGNDHSIAFKMAAAGDVVVTYNVEAGITLSGNFYVAVKYDYYITGCEKLGANWEANVEAFGMTDEDEDKTYEKALTLAAGEYYLKVTDGTWNEGKNWGSAALSEKYTEISDSEGNIKITLTEEKTFTVKFNSETMKISFDGLTPDETPTKYYIVGSFNEWITTDPNYELILDGEVYKKEVTFAKDVEFKVCDGTWANSWGKDNLGGKLYNELEGLEGGNLKMKEDKTFTIIFDLANNLITFEGLTEKAPAVVTYVLMGVNGDWTTGISMTQNTDPEKANEYVLTCQAIAATDAVKVVKCEDGVATAWYGSVKDGVQVTVNYDASGNIQLPAGTYNFYFDSSLDDKQLWIEAATYTRAATPGSFSTICLPYAGTISGATLFNLSDRDANYVYVVEAGTELEAGKPYVILPTAEEIVVTYKNYDRVDAGSFNALYGTYDEMNSDQLDGKYVITGDKYYYVDKVLSAGSKLLAYRAYFNLNELPEVAPVLPVGARRIALGTNGQNTATGMENVDASAQPVKTIINGQLYILRGEKMYDAQGKLVK